VRHWPYFQSAGPEAQDPLARAVQPRRVVELAPTRLQELHAHPHAQDQPAPGGDGALSCVCSASAQEACDRWVPNQHAAVLICCLVYVEHRGELLSIKGPADNCRPVVSCSQARCRPPDNGHQKCIDDVIATYLSRALRLGPSSGNKADEIGAYLPQVAGGGAIVRGRAGLLGLAVREVLASQPFHLHR
jgi:hypothetical protein